MSRVPVAVFLIMEDSIMGEEQITEDGERVDYHTVEITISRIRKKLEAYSGRTDFIITIRGRGYKFRK